MGNSSIGASEGLKILKETFLTLVTERCRRHDELRCWCEREAPLAAVTI